MLINLTLFINILKKAGQFVSLDKNLNFVKRTLNPEKLIEIFGMLT